MVELVRRFAGAIFLIVGSIISIAISSWQYQIDDGGATSESNWKNYCDNYPTSMLRRKSFSSLDSFHLLILSQQFPSNSMEEMTPPSVDFQMALLVIV